MQIFEYWVLRCVGVCLQQEGISLDQMLHFPLCKAKKSSRRLWESQIKGFVTPVMPGNSARILAALFFMFFWALVNSLFQAERAGFPVSAGVQTNKNGPRSPGSGLGYKGYTFSNFFSALWWSEDSRFVCLPWSCSCFYTHTGLGKNKVPVTMVACQEDC